MTIDSIYVSDYHDGPTVDFSTGDPMDVFAVATVFVQFDSDRADRRPVTHAVPGHPGRWILAYSSLRKLHAAAHGEDEIEYSQMPGAQLIADLGGAGVWYDRGFPDGRQILLPALDPDHDTDRAAG